MEKELEKMINSLGINKHFIEKRTIFLWGEVNEKSSGDIVKQLLYLNSLSAEDIILYINSPGGSVSAGLAIYDSIQNIKCDVSTICAGLAASMGALLLTCGTKGKRLALKHSRVLIHQPLISGQMIAPASDIKIHADEMLRTKETLNNILANHTGQNLQKIEEDTDRDYFMSTEEAIAYGLIDEIIDKL